MHGDHVLRQLYNQSSETVLSWQLSASMLMLFSVCILLSSQAGTNTLSMAYCKRSQFFQNMVKKQTPNKVATTWYRLLINGAANLAAVETHTRMTVMMANMMLMLFPSNTRASWVSSWTVCCCCCCWSSSLDTRVWHDSRASWKKIMKDFHDLNDSQVPKRSFVLTFLSSITKNLSKD